MSPHRESGRLENSREGRNGREGWNGRKSGKVGGQLPRGDAGEIRERTRGIGIGETRTGRTRPSQTGAGGIEARTGVTGEKSVRGVGNGGELPFDETSEVWERTGRTRSCGTGTS